MQYRFIVDTVKWTQYMYTRRCGLCGHYVILCNILGSINSPMQISPVLIYNIMFIRIHIKASIKDFSLRMHVCKGPWHLGGTTNLCDVGLLIGGKVKAEGQTAFC